MIHNVSPCAFIERAEVLVLFIFMNGDFLDSTPVGISHNCPHNSSAIPGGKYDKRSFITRKMGESRMGIRSAECFPIFKHVCFHVCMPPSLLKPSAHLWCMCLLNIFLSFIFNLHTKM